MSIIEFRPKPNLTSKSELNSPSRSKEFANIPRPAVNPAFGQNSTSKVFEVQNSEIWWHYRFLKWKAIEQIKFSQFFHFFILALRGGAHFLAKWWLKNALI